MRTIGVYLIFTAVVLRGVVISIDEPYLSVISGLLVTYGLLLFAETWLINQKSIFRSLYTQLTYLLLQSIIVIELLIVSAHGDVFALLFIPLSLDAVTFFGRRWGYLCIALFSLVLTTALLFSDEGRTFGLTMGVFFSGMCFLFGGYSSMVRKAEAARDQNQSAYNELHVVHHRLQRYADQVTNLAVEHERNRLARDLHDSVTQTVFSMNLTAQSASLLLDKRSSPVDKEPSRTSCSAQLFHLEELAANALSEIQSLVSQLKPRSITEEGLPVALRRLADERGSRDGLQINLDFQGEKNLSEAEILGLYFIVNEAVTNVLKHSGVRDANVRLSLNEDGSCLEIEDNGRGFDPQRTSGQRGHLGLAGMSERAHEIGWMLLVESNPNQGTRILVNQKQAEASE